VSDDLTAAVEELLGPVLRRTAGGVVVGVESPERRQVRALGRSGTPRPLDERTVFEIGSLTKSFTGTLLADMVERGEVRLDDPLGDLLPPIRGFRGRRDRPISLRALATHSAGLPRIPRNLLIAAILRSNDPYAGYTARKLDEALARTRPRKSRRFRYSNLGFALLGRALENAAGRSYEELVIERICHPLELGDTRFAHAPDEPRVALGHRRRARVPAWELGAFAPAGGLRSTPADLMRFVRANLDPEQTSIAGALELAQRPNRRVRRGRVHVCLGWLRVKTKSGRWVTWHNGGTGGFRASVAFDREAAVGAVALSNSRAGKVLDSSTVELLDRYASDRQR
jgi:D-alanyl-D-alanine-carboxypeptidase/D-alanyl-D-alanine-endopeptidase